MKDSERAMDNRSYETTGEKKILLLALAAWLCIGVAVVGEHWVLKGRLAAGFGLQALVGLILSLAVWPYSERHAAGAGQKNVLSRSQFLMLLCVVLISLFFRCYRIGNWESRLLIDEPIKGIWALEILHGRTYTPFFAEKEGLFVYLDALYLWLFGFSVVSLKLVAVTLGLLTTLTLFFLGRWLWSAEAGIAAAFLYSVSPWAISTNRLAERLNLPPLMSCLTVLSYLWATTRGAWWRMVVAGIVAGLGLWSFPTYRVVPVLILCLFVTQCIMNREFRRRHRYGLSLLIWAVSFLICTTVIVQGDLKSAQEHYLGLTGHEYKIAMTGSQRASNLRAALTAISYRSCGDMSYDPRGDSLEAPLTAVLFLMGLCWAVRNVSKPGDMLLLFWTAASLAPAILSSPEPRRFNLILPCIALSAGRVLAELWHMSVRVIPWRRLRAGVGILLCLALAIPFCAGAYERVFRRYYDILQECPPPPLAHAKFLEECGKNQCVLSTFIEDVGGFYMQFVEKAHPERDSRYGNDGAELVENLPLDFLPDRDVVYGIRDIPSNRGLLALFEQYYPQSHVITHRDRDGEVLFHSAFIAREEVTAIQGLRGHVLLPGKEALPFKSVNGHLWPQEVVGYRPEPGPLSLSWEGTTLVRSDGAYEWSIQGPSEVALRIDDREVDLRPGPAETPHLGRVFMSEGMHRIEITVLLADSNAPCALYRYPPGQASPPMPQGSLFTTPLFENPLKALQTSPCSFSFQPCGSIELKDPISGEALRSDRVQADSEGHLVVADYLRRELIVLEKDGRIRAIWDPLGGEKEARVQRVPFHVTPEGFVYVFQEDVIRRFDLEGRLEETFQEGLGRIQDVVTDPAGHLYVLGDGEIRKYGPGRQRLASWGERSSNPGGMELPECLAYGADGLLYVLDIGNRSLIAFTPEGQFVSSFPHSFFNRPTELLLDQNLDRYLVALGWGQEDLKIYDAQGRLMTDDSLPSPDCLMSFQGSATGMAWAGEEVLCLSMAEGAEASLLFFERREVHSALQNADGASAASPKEAKAERTTPDIDRVPSNILREREGFSPGLTMEIFHNSSWQGQPAVTRISGLERLAWDQDKDKPGGGSFSIRWRGWLLATETGTYRFHLTSDDGSYLDLDGNRVIDNGGEHGVQTKSGSVELPSGMHAIELRYSDVRWHGEIHLEWEIPGAGATETVPLGSLFHSEREEIDEPVGH